MIITATINCYLYRTEVGKSVFCGTTFLSHGDVRDCYVGDKQTCPMLRDMMRVTGLTVKSQQQKLHQVTVI